RNGAPQITSNVAPHMLHAIAFVEMPSGFQSSVLTVSAGSPHMLQRHPRRIDITAASRVTSPGRNARGHDDARLAPLLKAGDEDGRVGGRDAPPSATVLLVRVQLARRVP